MLAFLHGVDYEMVKALQFPEFLFRNEIHVRAVGDVAESVSQNRKLVMHASYRDYMHGLFPLLGRNLLMHMLIALTAEPDNLV